MRDRLIQTLILLLTLCSLAIALTVEYQNAKANHFLPRRDPEIDTRWRASLTDTPVDRLRDLVESFGLWQYLLAPCIIFMATSSIFRPNQTPRSHLISALCVITAIYSISLALYRGYFTSLGW